MRESKPVSNHQTATNAPPFPPNPPPISPNLPPISPNLPPISPNPPPISLIGEIQGDWGEIRGEIGGGLGEIGRGLGEKGGTLGKFGFTTLGNWLGRPVNVRPVRGGMRRNSNCSQTSNEAVRLSQIRVHRWMSRVRALATWFDRLAQTQRGMSI